LRKIDECEILEEISAKSEYVTYALIVYLSSVIAGGNVAFSSGFLWDKLFSPELSKDLAWASIGEANQSGMKTVGRDGDEKFMFRQRCKHLTNIVYQVVRIKTMSSGHEIPSTMLMNEHLKLAKAVCAARAGLDVDMDQYTDQTSRAVGHIPGSMFCDDLHNDAQVMYDEYHDDLENRYLKCITCANRKASTRPRERKRDPNVKNPLREPIPRPNRRMNNSLRIEYDSYCSFAFKYHAMDQRVLQEMKEEGRSFMDTVGFKDEIEKVSYHFIFTKTISFILNFLCITMTYGL
jgi:hypothetical protein